MSIPTAQLFQTVTPQQMLATLLGIYQAAGLPVTSWQSGDPSNTMMQGFANQFSSATIQQSTTIQGGFLDYAATVTPDPSVTPGVPAGWLDVLAIGYNVGNGQGGFGRIGASYAPGQITFTSTVASAGPYAPGTFHVASPTTGATYSNTSTFTIAGHSTTTTPFQADVAGSAGSAGPNTITSLVTTVLGVTATNGAGFVGANAESNAALVARCRAKLGTLSPNGPQLAYDYVSKTIPLPAPLATLTSGLLTSPGSPVTRTKQILNIGSGIITNYVANAAGAYVAPNLYTGSTYETISAVSNANPAQVTVTAHGYSSGDNIYISGTGLPALDGKTFSVAIVDANNFTVATASGGTSSTGTSYRQSDLDLINKSVQAYCAPFSDIALTATAPANNIAIAGTIYLKKGSTLTASQAQSQASTALTSYFSTLPLGGDDKGLATHFFLIEPMQNVVEAAMPNDVLECIITTPSADVPVTTAQDVATLTSVAFSVVSEV